MTKAGGGGRGDRETVGGGRPRCETATTPDSCHVAVPQNAPSALLVNVQPSFVIYNKLYITRVTRDGSIGLSPEIVAHFPSKLFVSSNVRDASSLNRKHVCAS